MLFFEVTCENQRSDTNKDKKNLYRCNFFYGSELLFLTYRSKFSQDHRLWGLMQKGCTYRPAHLGNWSLPSLCAHEVDTNLQQKSCTMDQLESLRIFL